MTTTTKALLTVVALPNKANMASIQEYKGLVGKIFTKHGGKPIMDAKPVAAEGTGALVSVSFLFPTKQDLQNALGDEEYVTVATPLRKQAFSRLVAKTAEVPEGTTIFSVGGIPNMSGTFMEYIKGYKQTSGAAGVKDVEGVESTFDEGTEPAKLVGGLMEFPSMEELTAFFETNEAYLEVKKLRPTGFVELTGVAYTV